MNENQKENTDVKKVNINIFLIFEFSYYCFLIKKSLIFFCFDKKFYICSKMERMGKVLRT